MVTELLGLFHDVGGEQDRPAAVAVLGEQVLEESLIDRIEPRERLVENEDLRLVEDCSDQLDLLLHALGELFHPRRGAIRQADALQPGGDLGSRHGAFQAMQLAEEEKVVRHSHLLVEAALLRQVADAILVAGPPGPTEEADLPFVGRDDVHQHPQSRRLARPVGAEEPVDAPRRNPERQVVYRDEVTEGLADARQFDGVAHSLGRSAALISWATVLRFSARRARGWVEWSPLAGC